jgi:hypothetical protein
MTSEEEEGVCVCEGMYENERVEREIREINKKRGRVFTEGREAWTLIISVIPYLRLDSATYLKRSSLFRGFTAPSISVLI